MASQRISPSAARRGQGRKTLRPQAAKRTLEAFYPYKWHIFLVLISLVITIVLGFANPLVIRAIIDIAIVQRRIQLLVICSCVLVFIPLVTGLVTVGQTYISNVVGQKVICDFRNKLYQRLQQMSLYFFTSTRTGELQSRLSNDINGVQAVVTNTLARVIANFAIVLSTLIAMLYISPLLTLITLILLPITLGITYKVGNIGRAAQKQSQQSQAVLTALMQETLSISGILLIKTFNRHAWVQGRFEKENQKIANLEVYRQMLVGWFGMLINVILALTPAAVYLMAGWQIINQPGQAITIGGIVAFTTLQTRLLPAVGQLLEVQVQIQGSLAMFERIFEYLDLPIDIEDAPQALQLAPQTAAGSICFSQVSFSYKRDAQDKTPLEECPDRKEKPPLGPTLANISFRVQPGQLVALVGPSGSGKTTLTYLVPRLYDVDSGAVEIDGVNVKNITQSSLHDLIGVVTQETYLFHSSIRENLLFARPEATEEEMVNAAKAAAIHDVIIGLENGYDTVVGERGYRLSGGEKQRVAIARVLLKDPRILILDEATSSLDTHSERLIQATLESLMHKRTTIAIAHRLSTILAADLILVVNHGRIIEQGTHNELLSKGGFYTRLYNEQFSQQPQVIQA